jgi:hypothetical protein
MTEQEYIEATNLAKVRIAYDAVRTVIPNHGAVTKERHSEIERLLARLLDDCFAETNTKENAR